MRHSVYWHIYWSLGLNELRAKKWKQDTFNLNSGCAENHGAEFYDHLLIAITTTNMLIVKRLCSSLKTKFVLLSKYVIDISMSVDWYFIKITMFFQIGSQGLSSRHTTQPLANEVICRRINYLDCSVVSPAAQPTMMFMARCNITALNGVPSYGSYQIWKMYSPQHTQHTTHISKYVASNILCWFSLVGSCKNIQFYQVR